MSACGTAAWKRCGRSARAERARKGKLNSVDARHVPREEDMSEMVDDGKRDFLKQASLITAAAGVVGATMAPNVSLAQVLETGVREDSVLAKSRKEGVLRVGYAQTGPW